ELVESQRHTPSLSAEEVQALLAQNADVVVLDARRFDEYQTMNIPGSTSVPGGELALRARELAPDPATRVIVNCAGRTRSIIGAQSLVNSGLPNPVAALRNGTIGWTLAGQALEHGAARRFGPEVSSAHRDAARIAAVDVARRAGVAWIDAATLAQWQRGAQRHAGDAGRLARDQRGYCHRRDREREPRRAPRARRVVRAALATARAAAAHRHAAAPRVDLRLQPARALCGERHRGADDQRGL